LFKIGFKLRAVH